MPELTRLRRSIRGSSDWYGDLEALLDAVDKVYEDLEITERDLSNSNSLEEETAKPLVLEHSEALVRTILSNGGTSLRFVLNVLVEAQGFEFVSSTLADFQPDEESKSNDSLGDLDNHPF